jgi:hypothetical protein
MPIPTANVEGTQLEGGGRLLIMRRTVEEPLENKWKTTKT